MTTGDSAEGRRAALIVGDVQTCVLMNLGVVPRSTVVGLLSLLPGERVRMADRPIARAVSPDTVTGVDCHLPAWNGTHSRGVGTVAAHVAIFEGRVLQGSVAAGFIPSDHDRRLGWSHYVARPGIVETLGRVRWEDVSEGFLHGTHSPSVLDLGAVGDRLISRVQRHAGLDRDPPFRASRTRVRWSAFIDELAGPPRAEFRVVGRDVRTLRLRVPPQLAGNVQSFCEDIAFHDWLLTTLLAMMERYEMEALLDRDTVETLRVPAEHLLHLWMPGAHSGSPLLGLWEGFEQHPGFSRQWNVQAARIRDRLAVRVIDILTKLHE